MENASNLFAALSMHWIVAASCFLKIVSCTPMVFDAWACFISAYSLASFIIFYFMVIISFLSLCCLG